MFQIKFEFKKFSDLKVWLFLLLVPLLVVGSLTAFHQLNPENKRSQEMRVANSLRADFSWRISQNYFDRLLNIEVYQEELPPTEEELRIDELMNAGERARFIYSADSYYERWDTVNQAKRDIWGILIELDELGHPSETIDMNHIHEEKSQIDWLVENNVGVLNPKRTTLSAFVLNNSFDILFSLPVLFLLIFFFGIPLLEETFTNRFHFTKVQPIKRSKVFINKFCFFASVLLVYIGSAVLASYLLHLLFDDLSLSTQLSFPMAKQSIFGLHELTLGQLIGLRIVLFVLITFVALFLVYIISIFWSNMLNNTLLLGFLSIIALIIVQSNPNLYQLWNVFAWLDTRYFIEIHSPTIITMLLLIPLAICFIAGYFVIYLPTWFNRTRSSRHYKGIQKLNKGFLVKHEWISFLRDNTFIYAISGLIVLTVYMGIVAYQEQLVRRNQFIEKTEMFGTIINNQYEDALENAALLEMVIDNVSEVEQRSYQTMLDTYNQMFPLYEETLAQVNEALAGNYDVWLENEKVLLESDRVFVTNPNNQVQGSIVHSTTIPMSNHIFIPNAVINEAIFHWKEDHDIGFVLPGGPYKTELLPKYEQSPRSGENEPPLGISFNNFEQYLNARQLEHNDLTGLNLAVDIINKQMYIFIWIIVAVFFMTNYVKEWDYNRSIRFIKVLPLKMRTVFTHKNYASLTISVVIVLLAFVLVFLTGSLLNGMGSWNFPYVRFIAKVIGDKAGSDSPYITIPSLKQYFMIVPLWRYLLEGVGLMIVLTWFINQLTHFMSLLIKKRWIMLAAAIVILVGGYSLVTIYPQAWMQFFPFYYINIPDILSGTTAFTQNFAWLNPYIGIGLIILYSLTLEFLNKILVRRDEKRDIR